MEKEINDLDKQAEDDLDQRQSRKSSLKQPRERWEESFRQMHENGDDKSLIPDVFSDEV